MDSSAQQDFDKLLKAVKLVWRLYATMTTPYRWKTVELRSARSTRRPYNEYALVCKHPDGDPDDDRHGPVAGFPLPQDFPRFVLPEEDGGCDLRDMALNWNRCDSSLTVMWPVVLALLKGKKTAPTHTLISIGVLTVNRSYTRVCVRVGEPEDQAPPGWLLPL